MLVEFPHDIRFTNQSPVAVADVAASLLANEQMVFSAMRVLENALPGLRIDSIHIRFIEATTNSPLKEALAAGILVAYQKDLTQQVPDIIEHLTGMHVDDRYKVIVTIIVLASVLYGVELAWDMLRRKLVRDRKADSIPLIQGNYNNIIQAGGDVLGIDPQKLAAAIQATFDKKQRRSLARRSLALIRPAQQEKGAAILGGGVAIEPATIIAAPSGLDIEFEEERAVPLMLPKHKVIIHASDRDRGTLGWAGHIPGVWEKRVPMRLFPGIAPSMLFGRDEIEADVMVTYKRDNEDNDIPECIHILALR